MPKQSSNIRSWQKAERERDRKAKRDHKRAAKLAKRKEGGERDEPEEQKPLKGRA